MKKVVTAALGLYLMVYLLPLVALGSGGGTDGETDLLPAADLAARQSAQGGLDRAQEVRVALEDGEILTLTMDEYLWRVVAAEMPATFEQEALNAQAAAARTYTVSKQSRVTANHPEAAVCTDVTCCQAYLTRSEAADNWGENAQAYADKITQAVETTDGQVILYEGTPIQAVFFSSTQGETQAAVEVWGSAVPYLSAVASPEGEEVPNYHTQVRVGAEQFRETLLTACPEADLSGSPDQWLGAAEYSSSGGVTALTIGGVSLSGVQLRSLYGLRSTHFTLTAEGEELVFQVTGYGHGVGMSQYGANAMAQAGSDWREILTWYYTGVTVETCPLWA
jgi:stage II sporulation protein D